MITLKDHLRAKGIIIMTTEDKQRAKDMIKELPPFKMIIRDELDSFPGDPDPAAWPFPSLVKARVNSFNDKVKVIELI